MDRFFDLEVCKGLAIAQFQLLLYGCLILILINLNRYSVIDVSYVCEVIFVVMGKLKFSESS